jgi:hypothetical protein
MHPFDTVIFSEKPFLSREIAPFLARQHNPHSTLIVHLMLAGPARFTYRRGLPLSAYPLISAPEYKLEPSHPWRACSLSALAGGVVSAVSDEDAIRAIEGASTFVFAGDPSASSINAFHGALALLRPDLPARGEHCAYIFSDLSQEALSRAMRNVTTTRALDGLAEQCAVKRYFEFNWNQNALVLFGRALRCAGAPADAMLSKFGLQALYFLQAQGSLTHGAFCHHMCRWVGTGKYAPAEMGSCASRHAILEGLHAAGLITMSPACEMTPVGEELLALLHPGCRDVDLPARLAAWMQGGLVASQPAMDRYLRTVFGRQARFQPG